MGPYQGDVPSENGVRSLQVKSRSVGPNNRLQDFYELPGESNRLLSMEGMRGLAVLLVFFVHFHALFGSYVDSQSWVYIVSRFLGVVGHSGVDLFFVLSGYLIYGMLIQKPVGYLRFMRRRVQRIFPTFMTVFVVYLGLSIVFPRENKIHGTFLQATSYILANFLLLPGIFRINPMITVAWSLSYEFFFYLTIPLLVWILGMRSWRAISRVTFFLAVFVIGTGYCLAVESSRVRLLMFIVGILLYEAMQSPAVKQLLGRRGEMLSIAYFVGSLGIIYAFEVHQGSFSFLPGPQMPDVVLDLQMNENVFRVLVLSTSCFLLCLYSFAYEGILKRILSWDLLRFWGNMSYSYYLIHGLTLKALALALSRMIAQPSVYSAILLWPALLLGLLSTWLSATILFGLIEKPLSLRGKVTPQQQVSVLSAS
jgi:exopolysaccharide production protein ExoZ